jgi:hypothetical protein
VELEGHAIAVGVGLCFANRVHIRSRTASARVAVEMSIVNRSVTPAALRRNARRTSLPPFIPAQAELIQRLIALCLRLDLVAFRARCDACPKVHVDPTMDSTAATAAVAAFAQAGGACPELNDASEDQESHH